MDDTITFPGQRHGTWIFNSKCRNFFTKMGDGYQCVSHHLVNIGSQGGFNHPHFMIEKCSFTIKTGLHNHRLPVHPKAVDVGRFRWFAQLKLSETKEGGVKCKFPDFYEPLTETIHGEWTRDGNEPLTPTLKNLQTVFQTAFRTAYVSGTNSQLFKRQLWPKLSVHWRIQPASRM